MIASYKMPETAHASHHSFCTAEYAQANPFTQS